jgi:hypothetical protein
MRFATIVVGILGVSALVVACGTSESGSDGGAEAGVCPAPDTVVIGDPCTVEGTTCPSSSVFCEAGGGSRAMCVSGKWDYAPNCLEGGPSSSACTSSGGTCVTTSCPSGTHLSAAVPCSSFQEKCCLPGDVDAGDASAGDAGADAAGDAAAD